MSFKNSEKKLTSLEVAKIAEASALMLGTSQEVVIRIKATSMSSDEYIVGVEYGTD